ncbi:hypothetical protein [Nocardiopsis changdeensis]|uniref:hypothetical protein n=1 Tax=Nocardiopsis changdeensis TaxID=2831969 RepID=UPI003F44D60C
MPLPVREPHEALAAWGFDDHPGASGFALDCAGGAEAVFRVEETVHGRTVALVSVHGVGGAGGSCAIEMVSDTETLVRGLGIEANLLVINHVFAKWEADRIYFWPEEDHLPTIQAYPAMLAEVAEPPGDVAARAAGRRTFVISREDWQKIASVFLRVLSGKD